MTTNLPDPPDEDFQFLMPDTAVDELTGVIEARKATRFRDSFTDEEWAERQARLNEALDDEYGHAPVNHPTAGEGCGS